MAIRLGQNDIFTEAAERVLFANEAGSVCKQWSACRNGLAFKLIEFDTQFHGR